MRASTVIAIALVSSAALAIVGFALGVAAFVKAKDCGNAGGAAPVETTTSPGTLTPQTSTTQKPVTTTPKVKNTQGWKDCAEILTNAMNESADPCEDFFEFSCGKWNQLHPMPNGTEGYYVYNLMQDLVYQTINESLNAISDNDRSDAMRFTKKIYQACIDNEHHPADHTTDVMDTIDSMGGFPLIHGNSKTSFSVSELFGMLQRDYFLTPIISATVAVDAEHVTKHSLTLGAGSLGMPASVYFDMTRYASIVKKYKENIKKVIAALNGTSVDQVNADNFINDVLEFETDIAKLMEKFLPDSRNHSLQYNPYNISEVGDALAQDGFSWHDYITALLQDTGVQPPAESTIIIVAAPTYLEDVEGYISGNATGDNFLRNYLMLRFALAQKDFMKTSRSTDRPAPLTVCGDAITNQLIYTVGKAYVTGADFDEQDRNLVSELTLNIRNAFSGMLQGLPWMDDTSKTKAQYKLANMAQTIGWPSWIYNADLLDAYYVRFNIEKENNYYKMYSNMVKHFSWTFLSQLEKSVNRHDFQQSPALVNAWYEPTYNSITLPAAILRPPQYRKDFPMAFNYGSTGNTPGHEITHGFDDEGVQYDYNGKLHLWMDESSQDGFRKMADCVVKEYEQFCYHIKGQEYCLNGKSNQGENIADNGGIRESYLAYRAYVDEHGEEDRLPGLEEYTLDQIYFLSFGYSWCGTESDDHLINRILTDPHSPPKYRVIGTLRNFEKFGEAFNCKRGDTMYPEPDESKGDGCRVWV